MEVYVLEYNSYNVKKVAKLCKVYSLGSPKY